MSYTDNSFVMYDDAFVVVKPVPSLMSSRTVSDAIKRGSVFAVNLRTSDLTILSATRLKTAGYVVNDEGFVVKASAAVLKPVFSIALSNRTFVNLPDEFQVAWPLIADCANSRSGIQVFSDQEVTPVGFPRAPTREAAEEFKARVAKLYQASYRKAAKSV